jgi:hypothetical protein
MNNSGPFARPYDAWAALRNTEWRLAVTGSSDAHDVEYVASALTRFAGRDAGALRQALLDRQTRAHLNGSWTMGRLARQWLLKCRGVLRDLGDPDRTRRGDGAAAPRRYRDRLVLVSEASGSPVSAGHGG